MIRIQLKAHVVYSFCMPGSKSRTHHFFVFIVSASITITGIHLTDKEHDAKIKQSSNPGQDQCKMNVDTIANQFLNLTSTREH